MNTPRMRMFAGPNGSGKSTLKSILPSEMLGCYVNPDDIESAIRKAGYIDFSLYSLKSNFQNWFDFFGSHYLTASKGLNAGQMIDLNPHCVKFSSLAINSYLASVLAFLPILYVLN